MNLAPLHREVYFPSAGVAGNHVDFGAENILQNQWMLIADRRLARGSEDRFGLEYVGERLRTIGTKPQATERNVLIHAADPAELGGIELGLIIAHQRLHDRRRRPRPKFSSIPGRQVEDVVGRSKRSGSGHVLRNDCRVSGNEATIMSGESPRIGVIAAARPVADLDVDGLPFEWLRRGLTHYCSRHRRREQKRKKIRPP